MRLRSLPLVLTLVAVSAACAADSSASVAGRTSLPLGSGPATTPLDVDAAEKFPDARCEANREAGTITFLSGLDFAAASANVDVIVAEERGYFDELCLDVEIVPSLAIDNYGAVAAGDAQFASGGSFSQLVAAVDRVDVDLVAATVEGRTAIDTLIVKAGEATRLGDLAGSTIGVTGAFPPSLDVMLRQAGLVVGEDLATVPLPGLDPVSNLALEAISATPGRKSTDVGALERAGVGVALFDPLDFGVPGSFGLIFTSDTFVDAHPTAAQDFVRATLRGLADAVADPAAASALAFDLILENGNPMGLSIEGETFRWETEAALILDGTPEGLGLGMPDRELLQAELDSYGTVGYFGDSTPSAEDFIDATLIEGVYGDDDMLIWPG